MTDKKILNLAQAELRAMYKRLGINGSNVLTLIDEALRQPPISGELNCEQFYCWDEEALGAGSRCKVECDICKNKGQQ